MQFTLEGSKKTKNPTESNIQEELENILTRKAEFVILRNSDEDCIQSIINPGANGIDSFRVEIIQKEQIYVYQGNLTLSAAYSLFISYLHTGRMDLKPGKWIPIEQEQPDPLNVLASSSNVAKVKRFLILTILVITLLSTARPLLLYFGIGIEKLDFFTPIITTILIVVYVFFIQKAFPGK